MLRRFVSLGLHCGRTNGRRDRGADLNGETMRHHILTERVTFSDIAGEVTSYKTFHTDEIKIDATDANQGRRMGLR